MTDAVGPQSRLSFGTKLAFGVGSIAYGIKDHGFGAFLLLYYNQVLGLPANWVGMGLAFALVADAVLDPVIGFVSDHWRSRLGRRHPFLYASALPLAVSYVLLWNPPAGLSQVQLTSYLVGITVLVRTFISFYEVPSAALIPELTDGYNERTSLISHRFFFAYGASVVIGLLALGVFMKPDASHPVGQLNPAGYVPYSFASAGLMFVAILASALGTQRHVMRAAPLITRLPDAARPRFELGRTLSEVLATVRNPGMLPIFGAGLFGGLAGGVVSALLTYIYTFFWELSANQIAVLSTSSVVSSLLGMAFATRLSSRYGKRNTSLGMSVIGLLLGPTPLILRLLGWFPQNGSDSIVPILFVLTSIGAACAMIGGILWYSMTADVVEDSQLRTGRRAEGLLFASNAFIMKCVSGLGLGVSGWLLDLVAFPQHAVPGAVPQQVLTRLAVTNMSLVGLLSVISIACLVAFPINEATHRANVARLSRAATDRGVAEPAPAEIHVA